MKKIMLIALAAGCCLGGLHGENVRDYKDYRGYRVLTVKPEPYLWLLGPYHTTRSAFHLHNFEMVESGPEILEHPEKLASFDLIYIGTRRKFTPEQADGLIGYLSKNGAVYANWGGPLQTRRLLDALGVEKNCPDMAKGIVLNGKFWGQINADNKLIFPEWVGHVKMRTKKGMYGHEMCGLHAASKEDEIARDLQNIPLGVFHRTAGGGRALTLGFVPENNKTYVNG
ncbi:MAG: hypothetical protein J5858_02565, partial [Lentisphaeria bacterium]|nr:hypothetical protein [Lentisphaeria bacterium]